MMTMTMTPFTSGPAAKTRPTNVCGELDPQRRGPTLRGCPAHTVLHAEKQSCDSPRRRGGKQSESHKNILK